jgi:hypothetical protein
VLFAHCISSYSSVQRLWYHRRTGRVPADCRSKRFYIEPFMLRELEWWAPTECGDQGMTVPANLVTKNRGLKALKIAAKKFTSIPYIYIVHHPLYSSYTHERQLGKGISPYNKSNYCALVAFQIYNEGLGVLGKVHVHVRVTCPQLETLNLSGSRFTHQEGVKLLATSGAFAQLAALRRLHYLGAGNWLFI